MEKLVLKRRDYSSYYSRMFYFWVFLYLMFIGIPLISLYVMNARFFSAILKSDIIPIFLISVLGILFYRIWLRKTYIEISDLGIKYVSGLPDFIGKYKPDWEKSWAEIQAVSITDHVKFVNPEFRYFLIRTYNEDYKIFPTRWNDSNKKDNPFSTILTKKLFRKKYVDQKIKQSSLYEVFEKRGLLHPNLDLIKPESEWTDINSSPIAIAMTSIFIASLFYFITETYFTLSEFYADKPPFNWFILIGILTVPIAYFWLKKSKLKPKEIGIMAVLVGFGIAMVSYPIILRLNQWTDEEGLQTYSYILKEDKRWKSEDSIHKLPDLIFDLKGSDYWKQFDLNAEKKFELRKGGLGFYQINMEPIYADQREFYEGKKKKVETAQK